MQTYFRFSGWIDIHRPAESLVKDPEIEKIQLIEYLIVREIRVLLLRYSAGLPEESMADGMG